MSTVQINYLQQKSALVAAARKWNVPYGILAGVYGAESSWGNNVGLNPFGFLAPTASKYGYPMTPNPSRSQFDQQAEAGAHALHDYYATNHNSWEQAIREYTGGNYGLAHVQALDMQLQQGTGAYSGGGISPAAALFGGSIAGLGAIAGTGEAAAGTLGSAEDAGAAGAGGAGADAAAGGASGGAASKALTDAKAIAATGGIAALLADPKFMLRLVEIIGGGALIVLGLRQLAAAAGVPLPGRLIRR